MRKILVLILIGSFVCCTQLETKKEVDIQGHRGARGLVPENSIPAFILAADMGVNTLELDLVVSRDSQLIVSHEPFFSPDFCIDPQDRELPEDTVINMYQLTYTQISRFDCGSKRNPHFPDQKTISVPKPLFSDVIDSVESFLSKKGKTIRYNIELKTDRATDSTFHPHPHKFSDLVYDLIKKKKILDRSTIQSFDFRTLQYFKNKYPEVEVALLIENQLEWKTNIDSLGFTPDIYSAYYKLLSQQKVEDIQQAGMKVIPWTINDFSDINKVLAWGVDGLITDYPDRAMKVIESDE